jgi:hypothetical protein
MRVALIVAALFFLMPQQQLTPVKLPPSGPPPVSAETYKKIRDLQYQQDHYIILLKDLKLQEKIQEDELQKKIDGLNSEINQAAYDEAQKLGVDPNRYVLELDSIAWGEKKGGSK